MVEFLQLPQGFGQRCTVSVLLVLVIVALILGILTLAGVGGRFVTGGAIVALALVHLLAGRT